MKERKQEEKKRSGIKTEKKKGVYYKIKQFHQTHFAMIISSKVCGSIIDGVIKV